MRRLLLLRHAKTERVGPTDRDRDRRLTERGRNDAPTVGSFMARHRLIPDLVLLSPGPELRVPVDELRSATAAPLAAPATLDEAEREHIVQALKQTSWVVGGPAGAAARLGMKRTTLLSRMRKLGIRRPR